MNMTFPPVFHGAKLALFVGDDLAVILRDDSCDIPWPDCWDFPGGGREGDETPIECALRETQEELGLCVDPCAVVWGKRFTSELGDEWFFVAHLAASVVDDIQLGDEGQCWTLMSPSAYYEHPKTISHLAGRLRVYQSGDLGDLTRKPPAV